MTNNATSIMMNREIGFKGWVRYPLIKSLKGGDVIFEIGEKDELSQDSSYCYKVEIVREKIR